MKNFKHNVLMYLTKMVFVSIVIRRNIKLPPILYTTHCPKCEVLEAKLKEKHIEFIKCDDELEMRQKGFLSVPILNMNGKNLTFMEAIRWVNSLE